MRPPAAEHRSLCAGCELPLADVGKPTTNTSEHARASPINGRPRAPARRTGPVSKRSSITADDRLSLAVGTPAVAPDDRSGGDEVRGTPCKTRRACGALLVALTALAATGCGGSSSSSTATSSSASVFPGAVVPLAKVITSTTPAKAAAKL